MEKFLMYVFMVFAALFGIWISSSIYRYDNDKLKKEYIREMRFFPWVSFDEYKKVKSRSLIIFSVLLIGLIASFIFK